MFLHGTIRNLQQKETMRQMTLLFGLLLSGLFMHAQGEFEAHAQEFNFWIGEWTVYKTGTDTIAGYSRIEAILDGKALQEHYTSTQAAYTGTSLNKYNPQTSRWEQYWIDNSGVTLHITGGWEDGKMVLQDENNPINRITWTPNSDRTVRQVWEQKKEGNEWVVVFDGHYKPK